MIRKTLTAALALGTTAAFVTAQDVDVDYDMDRDMDNGYESAELSGFGPQEGDWELIISGNGANDKDFDNGTGAATFEVGYYILDELIVGGRQGVGLTASEDDWNLSASTSAFIDYQFDLDRWRPFVGVSIGYLYGEDVEETFIAGPEAGVKYYVKPETFIYVRGAYEFLFDSADDADNQFDDGRFVYGLGIGFNF